MGVHEYSARIAGALASHISMCEKRLTRLALEGPDRFGPDDLDYLTAGFRDSLQEAQAAMSRLDEMAPDEPNLETMRAFVETYDRLFPEGEK
ncbi:hypothetical protein J7E87_34125 [Streptomyces sp. ISL-1]|uniref:hypothetical protein n=1 Tax=Streptomyces sp. ISL-1 TaxID=2817657 RepID=UPI001BE8FC81|nr:hypothetical protein [Streptomyces sp. ISL-1]MBT2394310.1 hypothetical protein [Streptomyces sp. ISL-1]